MGCLLCHSSCKKTNQYPYLCQWVFTSVCKRALQLQASCTPALWLAWLSCVSRCWYSHPCIHGAGIHGAGTVFTVLVFTVLGFRAIHGAFQRFALVEHLSLKSQILKRNLITETTPSQNWILGTEHRWSMRAQAELTLHMLWLWTCRAIYHRFRK